MLAISLIMYLFFTISFIYLFKGLFKYVFYFSQAIKLLQMKDLKEKEEKYVLIFKSADGSVLTLNHKRSIFSYGIEPYDVNIHILFKFNPNSIFL